MQQQRGQGHNRPNCSHNPYKQLATHILVAYCSHHRYSVLPLFLLLLLLCFLLTVTCLLLLLLACLTALTV